MTRPRVRANLRPPTEERFARTLTRQEFSHPSDHHKLAVGMNAMGLELTRGGDNGDK